jgi:hypothetical protein
MPKREEKFHGEKKDCFVFELERQVALKINFKFLPNIFMNYFGIEKKKRLSLEDV